MSSIPSKPAGTNPEDHFRRFFPYNLRLDEFTADEQFQLLYRAYLLCIKSNRTNELRLTSSLPTETFVARNKHGIACHPVFIGHELFQAKRHLLVKPTFMYKLMIKNRMLQVEQTKDIKGKNNHQRHSTYPEDFKVGDLLKFVVPNEYQTDSHRYRVASTFDSNEGSFRWLVTEKHPHGYPYKLSSGLDENLSVFEFEI